MPKGGKGPPNNQQHDPTRLVQLLRNPTVHVPVSTMNGNQSYRTRDALNSLKRKGDIRGWALKPSRGRPPKKKIKQQSEQPPDVVTPARPPGADTAAADAAADKQKKKLINWNTDENFALLRDAVVDGGLAVTVSRSTRAVPRTTLTRMKKVFAKLAKDHNVELREVTRSMVYEQQDHSSRKLLSENQVEMLEEMIRQRNNKANHGIMTRQECIEVIMKLKQTTDKKKCENHVDYLIRQKRLSGLKPRGAVVSTWSSSSPANNNNNNKPMSTTKLSEEYTETTDAKALQQKFNKVCDRASQAIIMQNNTNNRQLHQSIVKPSAYLHVEVSKDQNRLLNPGIDLLLMHSIVCGNNNNTTDVLPHKNKIAKRRLEYMISSNVSSYSRVLNEVNEGMRLALQELSEI